MFDRLPSNVRLGLGIFIPYVLLILFFWLIGAPLIFAILIASFAFGIASIIWFSVLRSFDKSKDKGSHNMNDHF